MPYFDDRTYEIGSIKKEYPYNQKLKEYAIQFYAKMVRRVDIYPKQLSIAAKQAIAQDNYNEILILADATTQYATHMENAFKSEWTHIKKGLTKDNKHELYILICIGAAAFYEYRWNGRVNYEENSVLDALEEYKRDYPLENLSFLDKFLRKKRLANSLKEGEERIMREERDREYNRQAIEKAAKQSAEKQERIKRKKEEQKARQLAYNKRREKDLESFHKLSLQEQIERILNDKNHAPNYYNMDFDSISKDELRDLPKELLIKITTSFTHYRDKQWKSFQRQVAELLSEEND